MINSSEAMTEYLKNTGRSFKAKIKLGDNIVSDNINEITLFSPLMSDKLSFGSAVSSYVEVSLFNCPENIGGCEAEIFLMTDAVEGEEIKLGFFTAEKPKTTDFLTTFTAYDRVKSKVKGKYHTALSGEVYVDEIFAELCGQCGVEYEPLYPDDTSDSEKSKIALSLLDGKDKLAVFEQIAAFFGGNLVCNRSGKFEVRTLLECTAEYDGDMTDTLEIGEDIFTLQRLTCTANGETLTKGTGNGIDFTCDIMTQSQLDKLHEALSGFSYRSVSCDILVGDPRIEVGDIVTVKQGESLYKVPVMQLELSFDGGITTKIESFLQTVQEAETERSESISEKIQRSTKYAEAAQTAHDDFIRTLKDGLDKGLYQTDKEAADGSKVTYYHDTPKIEDATYIQIFTSSGRAWAQGSGCWNNGDPNWQYGETKDGDAVLRDLLVRTLTADLIRAGKLSSFDGSTYFDLDNAELVTTAEQTSSSDTTVKLTGKLNAGCASFSKTEVGSDGEETVLSASTVGDAGVFLQCRKPEAYVFKEPENWSEMSDIAKYIYKYTDMMKWLLSSAYGVNVMTMAADGNGYSSAHLDGYGLQFSESEYRCDGMKTDGDVEFVRSYADSNGNEKRSNESLSELSNIVYAILSYVESDLTPKDFSVTYASSEEASSAQFVCCGSRVDMYYRGQYKAHSKGDLLFTVPAAYAPSKSVYAPMTLATDENAANIAGVVKLATDGQLTVHHMNTADYKTRIYFQMTYFI